MIFFDKFFSQHVSIAFVTNHAAAHVTVHVTIGKTPSHKLNVCQVSTD